MSLENGHKHYQGMHGITSIMAAGLQPPDKFGLSLNSRRAFANMSCGPFQRSLHMHVQHLQPFTPERAKQGRRSRNGEASASRRVFFAGARPL